MLTQAAWMVLLRRLYNTETGILALGRSWVLKLRNLPQVELGQLADSLWGLLQQLETIEDQCRSHAEKLQPPPVQLINPLLALRNLLSETKELPDEDQEQAFDLLFDDAARDELQQDRLAQPEEKEGQPLEEQSKRRVLVVDDRLLAIERFQAIEHIRNRFEWITLCELEGPCWHCPHQEDCSMKRARNFRELESALRREHSRGKPVDVILMDVRFDDIGVGELLPTPRSFFPNSVDAARALQGPLMVRALHERTDLPQAPVVLMTSRETLPAGAEKLLQGLDGLHFLDDEASLEALVARLDVVARRGSRPLSEGAFFWGRSPVMQHVREQIELLALGPRPVLLTGDSGSGKSFLVEEVLLPLSGRSHLITLDLSALPESLVESELFGHVKGAFSGAIGDRKGLIEEADGGILFIDEIGHLTPENQRKLLLFLQDKVVRRVGASHKSKRAVDVKVVAATHLDIAAEVDAGRFRFDLYMRLRPATQITLPPLAQRPEDLEGLMRHIVQRLASGPDLSPFVTSVARARKVANTIELILGHEQSQGEGLAVRLPLPTVAALRAYSWPGNTRELESVLDTLLLRALADARMLREGTSILEADHYLTLRLLNASRERGPSVAQQFTIEMSPAPDLKTIRQRLERAYLTEAFRNASGNMERMTETVLGSTTQDDRHRLTVRMNQLGLKVTELKHTR